MIRQLFRRTPITTLVEDRLYQAERDLLDAEAAYEHACAMLTMYTDRVERLKEVLAPDHYVIGSAGNLVPHSSC